MKKMLWSEIIESKRDEIEVALRKAKKDAYNRGMSGWGISVEIDDEDVWVNGLMNDSSQSQSSFSGTSRYIHTFGSWELEIDIEGMTEEEIEDEVWFAIDEEDVIVDIIEREIERAKEEESGCCN